MVSRKKTGSSLYRGRGRHASGTAVFSGSKTKRMNTGAGFLNAFIVLALIAIAHTAIVTDGFVAPPSSGPSAGSSSSGPKRDERHERHAAKRHPDYDWPPGPDQVPRVKFEPPPMRDTLRDEEERDALRRLVFSESETKPARLVDRARPSLSAEGSTTTGLFLIRDDAVTDEVAGIEGWGAGFMTF